MSADLQLAHESLRVLLARQRALEVQLLDVRNEVTAAIGAALILAQDAQCRLTGAKPPQLPDLVPRRLARRLSQARD